MIFAIVQRLLTIWLAITITFFALRLTAVDAVTAELMSAGADPALIEQRRALYGLNLPVFSQYIYYLTGLVRGDLGVSFTRNLPVSLMLSEALGSTLILAIPAFMLAVFIGIITGSCAGIPARYGLTRLARVYSSLAISIPPYWTGTLVIFVFSAMLKWLPSSGDGDLRYLILPVAVLAFHTSGAIARVVQTGIAETLAADFVRTARAKGLTPRIILYRHVLRVSLLPVITVMGLQAGFLLGGTVVTEILFLRPGLGRMLLDATLRRDYPVVQAIVLLSALVYLVITAVMDAFYRRVDPRI
ncbi:MAG: ABC transporter permease [Anaerolineae bacterium]|nr:ABC transporter permease [Anaerolineae bacterium]